MINSFDTDVAIDVGINAAIIYKNIQYWCEKNRTNEQHFHDGYYWTYNSISAYCSQFPYLSEKQIRSSLKLLEEKGYIKSSIYNNASYDRTKWYADIHTDKRSDCICPTGQMDLPQRADGFAPEGKPIPDIIPDIIPNNIDIHSGPEKQKKKFIPPTLEEVAAYCKERNNNVDPKQFFDYYSTGEWKDAKGNPVKNWKQKIITWEKHNKENKQRYKSYKSTAWVTGEEAGFVFNDNKTVDPEPSSDEDIPEDILNMFGD